MIEGIRGTQPVVSYTNNDAVTQPPRELVGDKRTAFVKRQSTKIAEELTGKKGSSDVATATTKRTISPCLCSTCLVLTGTAAVIAAVVGGILSITHGN